MNLVAFVLPFGRTRKSLLPTLFLLALPAASQAQFSYTVTDLGTFGGGSSIALRINGSGQVVGQADTPTTSHAFLYSAFLYSGGTMADLGTFGVSTSLGCAINAAGQVVGDSNVAGDVTIDAFVYSDGRMADLNDLIYPASGWRLYPTGSVTDPQGATSGTNRLLRGGSSTTTWPLNSISSFRLGSILAT